MDISIFLKYAAAVVYIFFFLIPECLARLSSENGSISVGAVPIEMP